MPLLAYIQKNKFSIANVHSLRAACKLKVFTILLPWPPISFFFNLDSRLTLPALLTL
jgi:hypothetical protein